MESSQRCFYWKKVNQIDIFLNINLKTNYNFSSEIKTTISEKVPDTITSWFITGFALSAENGLGLTERAEKLKVFKPFFIVLDLPYSIKSGEIVAVSIIVFNYLNADQTADVILYNAKNEFEFVGGRAPDNRSIFFN